MSATGIAGTIAGAFIESKLTPLVVIAAIILGIFAVVVTPREEEPQIIVPMIDVFVSYPGASASEVEARVTGPMEKILWEIEGIDYLYSISRPGQSMAIVRFQVGQNPEDCIVRLYNKLMSNQDRIPPGVSQPLVQPKSIDDVPILALTFWSSRYSGYELRRVATEAADELKQDQDVAEITITGGQRRQLRIDLDPVRLGAYHLSPLGIAASLERANVLLPSGAYQAGNREILVETGTFIATADDAGRVVVGVYEDRPVYLKDVARIADTPEEPASYVFMGLGPASPAPKATEPDGAPNADRLDGGSAADVREGAGATGQYEAVTVAIAKKRGTNATRIAHEALARIEALRGNFIPSGVFVTVTRNYGETAKEKSDELLKHMLIAAVSVTLLIAFALGLRESVVVGVAVPVTLALTIFVTFVSGYTLNRVTLFALIFSIGILVDDAIVVVENIHRHFKMKGAAAATAIHAVDEVGNPTILATFAVIAALLPMALVSGLMGPYMRPIPVGAAAAMVLSLLIAFIISPWLSFIVLRNTRQTDSGEEERQGAVMTFLNHLYAKSLRLLLHSGWAKFIGLILVVGLMGGAVALVPLKRVTVKMLPFDNKSELQVLIDMPEGSTMEQTARVAREIGDFLVIVPEVANFQSYAGAASPFNFNGLVRHYFLRGAANEGDIQVNLAHRDKRSAQSHEIAKRLRPAIKEIGDRHGARIKVVEIPPGPPVLSTLVAEVYGPDLPRQREIARELMAIFEKTDGVVDVDWYGEDDQQKLSFEVDREKAARHGIDTATAAATLEMALAGKTAGLAHLERDKEPVAIVLRLPLAERSLRSLMRIMLPTAAGDQVPLAELVTVREEIADKIIYHKNLKRVVYVTGDVAGTEESPVYAIFKMNEAIDALPLAEGYHLERHNISQPWLTDRYAMKWDGEWHITLEVFRDLGIAFAGVLVLIYIMVVGWFRSFAVPLVIMAPIPLSLVGILPGHAFMGAFFTATSMIGFIAGAGIVVRNSIILVDFIELQLAEGTPLDEAVVQAGIIRFRPMLLTAAAVVVGSSVILFDPIFQGMAISLMAGEVAATLLSRTMVPVLYYVYKKWTGPESGLAAEKG